MPAYRQFLIQPFRSGAKTGFEPQPMQSLKTEAAALDFGRRLAAIHGGAMVWAQDIDTDADIVGEPELVGTFGRVPAADEA